MSENVYFYNEGDIIEGTITRVVNYGVFLIFDHDIEGLLHISEITDNFVYNIGKMMKVGTTKKVKVMEVNPTNGFLKVSLKKVNKEDLESLKVDGKIRTPVDNNEVDFTKLGEKMEEWTK